MVPFGPLCGASGDRLNGGPKCPFDPFDGKVAADHAKSAPALQHGHNRVSVQKKAARAELPHGPLQVMAFRDVNSKIRTLSAMVAPVAAAPAAMAAAPAAPPAAVSTPIAAVPPAPAPVAPAVAAVVVITAIIIGVAISPAVER